MRAPPPRFPRGVRHTGPPRGEARLLASIAEALRKHVNGDSDIQTACGTLRRLGVSLSINLQVAAGDAPPQVTVPGREPGVPQWSEEDAGILRSLGIASDVDKAPDGSPSEPGRRQPR